MRGKSLAADFQTVDKFHMTKMVQYLVRALSTPLALVGLASADTLGKMYWTDLGANTSMGPRIQRADLDGSNIEDVVTTGLFEPSAIALDTVGRKM